MNTTSDDVTQGARPAEPMYVLLMVILLAMGFTAVIAMIGGVSVAGPVAIGGLIGGAVAAVAVELSRPARK